MASIILFSSLLIVIISVFATNISASKQNKGILLGVTLPFEALNDSRVTEIVKRYKKTVWCMFLVSLVLCIPLLIVTKYPSFSIIYMFILITAVIYSGNRVAHRYFMKMYRLKQENGWLMGPSHIVRIDTEVSRNKNKMPISILWYIPAFIICCVPLILTLAGKSYKSSAGFILSITTLLMILIFIYIYNLCRSQRVKVYSEKTEINMAINYVHKRLWSICWAVVAAIFSICELAIYLGIMSSNTVIPFAFIIGQSAASLFCIIFTYNKIRDTQNRLLQTDKDIVYADDDEYWIRGYYYNPNDSRTTVEKRYGYGYAYNMATRTGKFFVYGLASFAVVVLICLSVVFITLDTASFSLSINGDTAKISAPIYGYSFNVKDIEEVKMADSIPNGTRTNGAATSKYSLGNFNLDEYGRAKLYVYNENPPFIAIKLKDIYVFLNGKTRDKTDEYYRMLIKK